MKHEKFAVLLIALIAALASNQLSADEGRIPIFGVTTITLPGSYVLTRDLRGLPSGTGTTIKIQTDNVTLDLNGLTITPAAGLDAITVDTSGGPRMGIWIRNGRIVGGSSGIVSTFTNPARIRIENVEISGATAGGIFVANAKYVEVLGCRIHEIGSRGIQVDGSGSSFEGRFIGNEIRSTSSYSLYLAGLRQGEIRGNVVQDFGSGSTDLSGILLFAAAGVAAGGNLIEGNFVSSLPGGTDDTGIIIEDTSPNNVVRDNVVTRNGGFGISVAGNGTRIERNVVSRNGLHGILIGSGAAGSFMHIEDNQAQENTNAVRCGIFVSNGNGHSFRNNNVRGNAVTGLFVSTCMPTIGTNSDDGGNIL